MYRSKLTLGVVIVAGLAAEGMNVAAATAIAVQAEKLIFMMDALGVKARRGELVEREAQVLRGGHVLVGERHAAHHPIVGVEHEVQTEVEVAPGRLVTHRAAEPAL